MKSNLTYLFALLFPFISICQTPGKILQKHQAQYPVEKVYIAHDRPYYAPGDTIWCQAHLLEGRTHLAFDAAPILYVEWYNETEECLGTYNLKIKEGTAAFEIATKASDSSGVYYLRAYTQYQRNFDPEFIFQKKVLITAGSTLPEMEKEAGKKLKVQFFPEGGYAVNSCKSKVAFKITDEEGQGVNLSGILQGKSGSMLTPVKAVHEGIGTFNYTPAEGGKYTLAFDYKGKQLSFDLPKALPEGYVLSINNRAEEFFEIAINASPELSLGGLILVGHIRGQVFFEQEIQKKENYLLRLPRAKIPSGILHLSLFDQKNRPIAERLVFNQNPEEKIQVSINNKQETYVYKDKVSLNLNALLKGQAQEAKLSLSVYNSSLVKAQKNSGNILNYLWLQSDLKGHINNINQYFENNSSKNRVLLDYLMMTHAWRRFKWQEVLTQEAYPINYPPQEHINLAGKVTKKGKKEGVKADVFLSINSKDQFSNLNITTEDDGLFFFKGFDFTDTTDLILQANLHNEKKKGRLKDGETRRTGNKNVDIEIIDLHNIDFQARSYDLPQWSKEEKEVYAKAVENIKVVEEAYSNLIQADISEVTVEASRLASRRERLDNLKATYREKGLVYTASSKKLFMDDVANKGQNYPDLFELIGARFPGLIIDRSDIGGKKIFMRNANVRITQEVQPAILIIDGTTFDLSLGNIPPPIFPIDVETIDVIGPVRASGIYGEQAIGGAIVILTRETPATLGDQSTAAIKGTNIIQHPGYYAARDFYVPDYSKTQKADSKPDLRTTLYWKPEIQLNKQAQRLEFYTGDQAGIFTIQIEGISAQGIPFVHWEEFEVKSTK